MPRCYAVPTPIYQPAMRLIASITNATIATVTTTFAHQYNTGLVVRFNIPVACGMQQINQQTAPITVTGSTTFTVPINTTNYEAFAIPGSPNPHEDICAQVTPVGEVNTLLNSATRNILP